MTIHYDRRPGFVICPRCDVEHPGWTPDEIYDSGGPPSTLCDECLKRATFFAALHAARTRRRLLVVA